MGVWAFVFMFVVLKVPLAMLLWIVWWAVREVPAEAVEKSGEDDGGGGSHGPRPRLPRPPRRGPHGDATPPAPRRVRVQHRRRVARPLSARH